MTDTKELIVIKPAQLAEVFVENGLDPFIELIKKEVEGIVPDVSTKKGRDAIKSRAYWVAQKKTLIDNAGKKYVADLKGRIKPIDVERKRMRDILEELQAEIKQPLVEWQAEEDRKKQVEEDRVEAIQGNINSIKNYLPLADDGSFCQLHLATSKQIQTAINRLSELKVNDSFAEFKTEAETVYKTKLDELGSSLTVAIEREELAVKAKRLDDEERERKQKKKNEKLENEGEAKAKRVYEAGIQERINNISWHDKIFAFSFNAQSSIDALSAININETFGDRKEYAEDLRQKIVGKLKNQFEQLQLSEKEEKEKEDKRLKKEADESAARGQKGIEDARIAEKEKRSKDAAHRLKINTEVLDALKKIIPDKKLAEKVLVALSLGKIPNATINY